MKAELLSIREYATYHNITEQAVYKKIKAGKLSTVTIQENGKSKQYIYIPEAAAGADQSPATVPAADPVPAAPRARAGTRPRCRTCPIRTPKQLPPLPIRSGSVPAHLITRHPSSGHRTPPGSSSPQGNPEPCRRSDPRSELSSGPQGAPLPPILRKPCRPKQLPELLPG